MSNLESERAILTELYSKHGALDERVIKQSQRVDKLITEETKRINNIK